MRNSGATRRWIASVLVCALHAAGCQPDATEAEADAGPPPEGMLSGPGEACVGDTATITLQYAESSASTAPRYEVWLTGTLPNTANEVFVTVNPGVGEYIRVPCRAEGRLFVRARGPSGDSLSEPLSCVECGNRADAP